MGQKRSCKTTELTIDAAKQICMLQRNEKGRQARLYFIDVEKRWNNPEMIMARALKMADNRLHLLEIESKEKDEKIKEMEPKALFADAVSTSETTILIGELAKILKGNGIDIGQNRLFQRLREDGFLIKRKGMDYNMPTQVAMEKGLFRIKETAITHSDGHVSISKTTKVTGKGQQYFVNYFLEEASCPLQCVD